MCFVHIHATPFEGLLSGCWLTGLERIHGNKDPFCRIEKIPVVSYSFVLLGLVHCKRVKCAGYNQASIIPWSGYFESLSTPPKFLSLIECFQKERQFQCRRAKGRNPGVHYQGSLTKKSVPVPIMTTPGQPDTSIICNRRLHFPI